MAQSSLLKPRRTAQGFDPARWEKQLVAAILALYVLLAFVFSLGPIFEGPDELQHYRMIRFILTNHDLPTLHKLAGFESHQPPVYYVMVAPIKSLFDDSDFAAFAKQRNPFYGGSGPDYTGNYNRNLYLHSRSEAFPYNGSGIALTLHVLRLFSIVMGLATVIAGYRVFSELWPDRPDLRLGALGVIAFWPIGVYFAGLVNNDLSVDLFATIALLLVMYQVRLGPSWRRAALLGAVLGLAVLSKINALYMVLPVGAAVLTDRRSWRYAVVTLLGLAVVAGWWFVRNMQVAGEPTGITLFHVQVPAAAVAPGTQTFAHWWPQMVNTYQTMWARFGTESIPISSVLQYGFDLLVILSIAGMLWRVVRFARAGQTFLSLRARQWMVVGLFAVSWFAAEAHAVYLSNIADHGHLYLAGLVGFAACIAVGLDAWTPIALRMRVALSLALLSLAIVLACMFGYLPLAYQPLMVPSQVAHPLSYRYSDMAEMTGTEASEYRARPGDTVHITIDWRALRVGNNHTIIYLHSLDSDIVNRGSLPGNGNLPGEEWSPGQTWSERYSVTIPANAEIQRVYPLVAGLYDQNLDSALPVVDASGAVVDPPVIGRLIIGGPILNEQPDYHFGALIGLKQPDVSRTGSDVRVCFRWISLQHTTNDYHVFVHVLDPAGKLIAQTDVQPRSGQYPTSAWAPGESISDCVSVASPQIPASGWRVAAGLYDLSTGARLPVTDPQGQTLPDAQVIVQP